MDVLGRAVILLLAAIIYRAGLPGLGALGEQGVVLHPSGHQESEGACEEDPGAKG